MNSNSFACVIATFLLLVGVAIPTRAQSSGQPNSRTESQNTDAGAIKIETTLVTIPVSVLDKNGKYVSRLTKEDFRIYDDSVVVAEGAQARLSLQTQLSSKLSEVGDEVRATLHEAVRGADGRVAIPRGTDFVGRVTQVQPARRPQKQATLTVVFDTMRLSYGTEKVSTVVTAIDDFANDEKLKSKDGEGKVGGGRSGGRTARNAGTGATLGGVGGLIIGAAGGGLGGAAAAAGAGVIGGVLMTKGNDIKLQPGTILRIRFERPVNLPDLESEHAAPRRDQSSPLFLPDQFGVLPSKKNTR